MSPNDAESPVMDCCAGGGLMRLEDALAAAQARLTPVRAQEEVALADGLGRVLAAPLTADRHVPPADNSAMDGYALRRDSLQGAGPVRLAVVGQSLAGQPYGATVARGEAIRIGTGALIPDGADAVVMQERCRIDPHGRWIELEGPVAAAVAPGAHIRRRGEDVTPGDVLLAAGRVLRPQDIALAAGQGIGRLAVIKRLRVGVFSTGDELSQPGIPCPAGGIYDTNRFGLMALLRALDCEVVDLGILPDRLAAITEALGRAAPGLDAVFTSGGVSVGKADFVKPAVEALGEIALWKLAIKPGKPVMFGRIGDCAVFGLPGNPVSMLVTFMMFARPLVRHMMGAQGDTPLRLPVPAGFSFNRRAGRREWLRGRLIAEADGSLKAQMFDANGSGVLSSVSWAEGLIELPEDCARIAPGDEVVYLPLAGLGAG